MLTDLYAYLTTSDLSQVDATHAAGAQQVRNYINNGNPPPAGQTQWRLYPDTLAEGATLPALTYQLISSHTEHSLDGTNQTLFWDRVQVDVWATLASDRINLSAALIAALDGLTGMLVNTELCVILWDNSIDTFEPERLQYRRTLDFRVIHN
jgi:hypothetical protein